MIDCPDPNKKKSGLSRDDEIDDRGALNDRISSRIRTRKSKYRNANKTKRKIKTAEIIPKNNDDDDNDWDASINLDCEIGQPSLT